MDLGCGGTEDGEVLLCGFRGCGEGREDGDEGVLGDVELEADACEEPCMSKSMIECAITTEYIGSVALSSVKWVIYLVGLHSEIDTSVPNLPELVAFLLISSSMYSQSLLSVRMTIARLLRRDWREQ